MPKKTFVAGEVLTAAEVNEYLMDQAVMTFAGTAARGSAIASPSEGMVSYLEDSDVLQVYGGTAVGWADYRRAPVSGNAVINGDFGVWQRGTSGFTTGNAYTADRWLVAQSTAGATYEVSRQAFTPADIEVVGYGDAEFYARLNITTISTGSNIRLMQRIEDARTLSGQTVTLSFWARSSTQTTMQRQVQRSYGSGGSSFEVVFNSDATISSSWQRITTSFTMPTVSGKTLGTGSYVQIYLGLSGADGDVLDLWGVQLEAGSVATPFRLAGGGSKAAELALCQRYYYRVNPASSARFATGFNTSTAGALFNVYFPTEMRTSPSALEQSGTASDYAVAHGNFTVTNFSSVPGYIQGTRTNATLSGVVAGGLTGGQGSMLIANNTNAYLAWSAEL